MLCVPTDTPFRTIVLFYSLNEVAEDSFSTSLSGFSYLLEAIDVLIGKEK